MIYATSQAVRKGKRTGVKYLNNNMIANVNNNPNDSLTVLSKVNGFEKGELILTFISFLKSFV